MRTYADFCQRQGRQIEESIARESAKALEERRFDAEGGTPLHREAKETLAVSFGLSRERLEALTPELENPEESCYVSPDDVMVRRQKERRTEGYRKEKAFVKNTVMEVQTPENSVILTATGMKTAFLNLLAYLLSNGLLNGKNLVFFTDGAKDLRGEIHEIVRFSESSRHFGLVSSHGTLQSLSERAFKGGKEQRNQILPELFPAHST